ncbi:MAG TPA: DinB family protein [Longimicrobiaceae bacterium]|nr:DinB family protein [Longimicrobiaceae bacterium]
MSDSALREQIAKLLAWREAHAGFDRAVDGLAPELRGRRPDGLPHSPWELLEHIRLAQHDILDFTVNPHYIELRWPDDYGPPTPAPPSATAWAESVALVRADREALQAIATDESIDLAANIPHGSGQTYLRELLLAADHMAYHVGQLVLVRQLLGAWE